MRKLLFVIKIALVTVLAAGLLLGTGCQQKPDPNAFLVYYINDDRTGLVPTEYELQATDIDAQIDEILSVLATDTGRVDILQTIPSNVELIRYQLANGFLKLYFSASYSEMDEVNEVLCRAGVVQTLMQLKDITNVAFYVGGEALTVANGETVGVMNADSFIDNPGEDMQYIQERELTLYFASADGKSLVKEVQRVHYNSNMPVEKKVIEQLLKSPSTEGAQMAIPSETKLINISVLDGICVVNFDDGFFTHNYDIAEEVVIYSIVNSLTELDTIKTVQISVNGETNRVYLEKFSLADQYTRDLSLVAEANAQVEVVDEAAPQGGVLNNRIEQN